MLAFNNLDQEEIKLQFYMPAFQCKFLMPFFMVASFYVVINSMGGNPSHAGYEVIKVLVMYS